MNKNYPIYKTTFIEDMRSLVEEAAQNFSDSTAISYKENYWDKEVRKVTFDREFLVHRYGYGTYSHHSKERAAPAI